MFSTLWEYKIATPRSKLLRCVLVFIVNLDGGGADRRLFTFAFDRHIKESTKWPSSLCSCENKADEFHSLRDYFRQQNTTTYKSEGCHVPYPYHVARARVSFKSVYKIHNYQLHG